MSGRDADRPPGRGPSPYPGLGPARTEPGRGGFGGQRWAFETPPAGFAELEDQLDDGARGGFGARHHGGVAPAGVDLPVDLDDPDALDADESGERGPKRRRGPAPHPYPRKVVASLGANVRVTRDATGLAHISARGERDAYCALGLVMAEDRLWQLDLLRRLATGRAAEVLGRDAVAHDAVVRTIGIGRRAMALARRLDGLDHETLAAFAAGVNAVRGEGPPAEAAALGLAIDPWTIADSLAIEILWGWWNSLSTWPEKLVLARAVATSGLERARWLARNPVPASVIDEERTALWRRLDLRLLDLLAIPGAGQAFPDLGGNAWALGGATRPGTPAVVAGDPHLPATLPGPMIAVHLEAPGFSVIGGALVGSPAVMIGRNRKISWAFVPARVDDADCLLEDLDGIGRYRDEGGWAKLQTHSEVIRVRGEDSVRITVRETPRGPLLGDVPTALLGAPSGSRPPGLSLRWTGGGLGSGLGGWLTLARATSLDDVAAAAALLDRGPLPVHLVAGDASGRVGGWTAGPELERDGLARLVPVLASRPEGRWGGVAGLSRSATASASEGIVVITEELATVAARTSDTPPPRTAEPRAARAAASLKAAASAGASTMRSLQTDVVDPWLSTLGGVVVSALDGQSAGLSVALDGARRLLSDSLRDGEITASGDSAAPSLLFEALLDVLPADLFPESRFPGLALLRPMLQRAVARIVSAEVSPWFVDSSARDAALRLAVERAWANLAERFGSDSSGWRWARRQQAAPRHVLADQEQFSAGAPEPTGAPGSPFTVLRAIATRARPCATISTAPALRWIADLSTDEAQMVLPAGQSGVVTSPNFLDQAALWRDGQLQLVKLGTEIEGSIIDLVGG